MKKNSIDEYEAFEINPGYSTFVETFKPGNEKNKDKWVKVVIVDDFYKNPAMVRQLALDIPASQNKRIRGGNPALRINAFYDLSPMAWVFDQLIRTHFHEEASQLPLNYLEQSFTNATFMVNVMQTKTLPPIGPHMDSPSGLNFASTIYLNDPNESNGGTSFYAFGGKTKYDDTMPKGTYDVEGKMPILKYINDDIHDWRKIGMAPMKFNRMVLYKQEVLHTAYVKEGMFVEDNYRLNQQFFI